MAETKRLHNFTLKLFSDKPNTMFCREFEDGKDIYTFPSYQFVLPKALQNLPHQTQIPRPRSQLQASARKF